MFRISCFLWLVYFSIAPVYWLPGVDGREFLLFKTAMIVSAVCFSFLFIIISNTSLHTGFIGVSGFLLLFFLCIPGFLGGDMASVKQVAANLSYSTCIFIIFSSFAVYSERIIKWMAFSAIPIVGFSLYSSLAYYGLVRDYSSPFALGGLPVSVSGFTGLRTGWSNGIAMYVPILLLLFFRWKNIIIFLCVALGVAGIFSSQLVTGGRGGMLATVVGLLLVIFLGRSKLMKFIVPVVLVVLAIELMPYFSDHLRLNRIEDGVGLKELNHLSAGRLGSYLYALDLFMGNPVFGGGFGNSDVQGHSIHNVWLKFLADTGLLFVITFLYMFIKVIKNTRKYLSENYLSVILTAVLIEGMLSSMVEPSMILGSFQNSAIWWASFGLLSGMFLNARSDMLKEMDPLGLKKQKDDIEPEN